MNRLLFMFLLLLAAVFTGCSPSGGKSFSVEGMEKLYVPQYAEGFDMYACGASTLLVVKKPWQGSDGDDIYYFLAREGETPPEGFKGEVLSLPLNTVVAMSTSYIAFMELLGVGNAIKGVSGGAYISSEDICRRLAAGEVRDVGYESGLNNEVLVDIAPDVIMLYGITGENSIVTDKIKELGLNFMYIGDYLENSPCGRAEWLVVMGEIMDKRAEAESLFGGIADEYEKVKELAAGVVSRPGIMLNAPWRDTWFVPGDKSYMVRLINDAGGDYVCKGNDTDQTRPISTESAYLYAVKADLWINPGNANTIAELTADNPNFAKIPAVTSRAVYNNNKRQNGTGGSDFWESGTVNPHIILKDMVKILHPELEINHDFVYFKQLK